MFLSSLINLTNLSMNASGDIVSSLTAIVLFVICLLLPPFLALLIKEHSD